MRVALVNLTSNGRHLANALAERGVSAVHVYQPELRHFCDSGLFAAEDEIPHESFTDTTQALKRLRVHAVLAGGELGVTLSEELAAALALPHNELSRTRARRDKFAMARTLQRHGIPVARTERISSLGELGPALRRIGRWPIVVKPVGSAASDGVTVCHSRARLREAVAGLLNTRNLMDQHNSSVLLQEYLDGPQYSIDSVSRNGRHLPCAVTVHRFEDVDGFPLWRGRRSLTRLGEAERDIVDYTLRCLDALGVTDSASNAEVRLTSNGPRLVEVNARLGGPALPTDLFFRAFGYSPATLLADSILGNESFTGRLGRPYAPKRCMATVALVPPADGIVRAMPGLDAIRDLPTFHSFAKLPTVGSVIQNRLLNLANGGVACFIDKDPDAVAADVEQLHRIEAESRLFVMDTAP